MNSDQSQEPTATNEPNSNNGDSTTVDKNTKLNSKVTVSIQSNEEKAKENVLSLLNKLIEIALEVTGINFST